ncbi:MAG: hypothetical protein ACD_77C00508G0008 [uncultured bacterium]|nr:MAG: hypothetical protein ACD_77C00508G0008 [uncultured bacterium]
MPEKKIIPPDYLFEVSWEVCNKVGGIHTVIATKALNLSKELKNNHILLGPDVWRETDKNPEFTEDPNLFRAWRMKAAADGLRIRVGRWDISGNPIAILVDFSHYITKKDEILTEFWKKFNLDSLIGQWDYVESALFGYASGLVIESFVKFNLLPYHKVVAQFHEWMTGAGLLYIKSTGLPIATVFTTHATVIGRSIAGNGLPLYDFMENYNADEKAKEFNVTAKHSLEKVSATEADVFTTVSEITAKECIQFLDRKVDIVTPNGFENSFTPSAEEYESVHASSRKLLLEMASVMSGYPVAGNALILAISGRYEYKNKGIDIFLDALGRLNNNENLKKEVIAYIFVPAAHHGPNKDLINKIQNGGNYRTNCSHYLSDPDWDPVVKKVSELNLLNREGDRVRVFFIPSYLNGNDGIFNKTYYSLLVGLDLTIFPSYYEPFGYTPLESLAFSVPTITTTLAGFGLWVQEHYKNIHPGIQIVERNDHNYEKVVKDVESKIAEVSALPSGEEKEYRNNAKDVSGIALWDNQIKYYKEAYSMGINKIIENKGAFPSVLEERENLSSKASAVNSPNWSTLIINKQLPERLQSLDIISKNLWWSWNEDAIELFKMVDEQLWKTTLGNPILMLDFISLSKAKELENDTKFLKKLDSVYSGFKIYMAEAGSMKGPKVAYFSMEYGLDPSLKIYSGGLGILAGDYLKESSDKMVPMTGIGLLYKYGYFTQKLSAQGDQVAEYEPQDFTKIPVTPVRDENDNWVTVSLALPGRNLNARLWRTDVGRTELILMDTDFEDNLPEDRSVTHYLYGGDWENRLKQEMLLGIGGIRALRALNKEADVYHCNEGHAAFIGLERLREFVTQENLTFGEAVEVVRSSSLFTTHTPVPAGHDSFGEDILRKYMSHYPSRLKISWEMMMSLGKLDPSNSNEKFSMSNLACNLSQEINGVSWLHGKVSREILSPLWPGYLPEELNVGYVTNGVHYPTWTAAEWKDVHADAFGDDFATHNYDKSIFEGIYNIEESRIWSVRSKLRTRLIRTIKNSLSNTSETTHYTPQQVVAIKESLRDDILTIGFARRFATYKRAHLLLKDLQRLDKIVNNPKQPIQFIFAGKAHPADKAGQDLIRHIVEVSLMPQFTGKIVFVPGYDMTLAKRLVQGVDVWMNTPTRPLEASGTSGEKAAMNGVMHFSVLDGWWVEGYKEGAGWALPMERTYENQSYQDDLDAATIYNMLENEIAPVFYNTHQGTGIPMDWVMIIKNTIAKVAANFTTNRMISDYCEKYYNPLAKRHESIIAGDFALAREIAFWKKRVRSEWPHIEVKSFVKPDNSRVNITLGNEYHSEVELSIGDLSPEDIGVEIVLARQDNNKQTIIKKRYEFKTESFENGIAKYVCNMLPDDAGVYTIAGRIYAKNPNLANRQDFDLVKWL